MSLALDKSRVESKGGPPENEKLNFDLRLSNPKGCRNTLARILREYSRGSISESFFKALTWGVSQQLAWFKHEREGEIEKRLEALEKTAEDLRENDL